MLDLNIIIGQTNQIYKYTYTTKMSLLRIAQNSLTQKRAECLLCRIVWVKGFCNNYATAFKHLIRFIFYDDIWFLFHFTFLKYLLQYLTLFKLKNGSIFLHIIEHTSIAVGSNPSRDFCFYHASLRVLKICTDGHLRSSSSVKRGSRHITFTVLVRRKTQTKMVNYQKPNNRLTSQPIDL